MREGRACATAAHATKKGNNSHGTLLKRYQEHERPVRAHAARYLLCRKTDREGAAWNGREKHRSAAQAGIPNPSSRNGKSRETAGASIPTHWRESPGRRLPCHRRHSRGGRRCHRRGGTEIGLGRGVDRRGTSRRTLRDDALWNADRVGHSARPPRVRDAPPADARGGKDDRQETHVNGGKPSEPESGLGPPEPEMRPQTRVAPKRRDESDGAAVLAAPSLFVQRLSDVWNLARTFTVEERAIE